MKKLLIPVFCCTLYMAAAQTTKDIDAIFAEFDSNHPAVATVVLHKGKVVYQKAFGSLHLDHKSPATIDTKFQLAGLSKHFTAFAIFLLIERGVLSLDDDIRKHLPKLPNYSETISIRHLLSSTSGLPDIWALKSIAGWHSDDVFTQAHAMKMIEQVQPGFSPGEDYIYSNTDQVLLAEIIVSASGKSYGTFMKEELFDPLEMNNTLAVEDFEQYIPNLAASYEPTEGGFKRSALNNGIMGATNIYSTVADLAKWELNLLNPKVGNKKMIDQLYTNSTLNNGQTLDPLFGRLTMAQQQYHQERGIPKYYQTGNLGGYTSSIFKFKEHEFTAIVLSSGLSYNGHLGMQAAGMYLDNQFTEPAEINFTELKTKKLPTKQLEKYVGIYWNERSGYSRNIALKADTLRYVRSNMSESSLLPLSKSEFQMVSFGDEKIGLTFDDKAETMSLTIGNSSPVYSKRVAPFSYSTQDLAGLTGTYYCKALSVTYELVVEDGKLTAKSLRTEPIHFKPIKSGLFESDQWYIGGIQFKENDREIEGFTLSVDEVRDLWFERL